MIILSIHDLLLIEKTSVIHYAMGNFYEMGNMTEK